MADTSRVPQTPAPIVAATPRFADYTRKLLFEEVWERDGLPIRDKCLATFSCLIAVNRAPYIAFHGARALDNGMTPRELSEIVAHLSFYCGWPMATAAAFELAKIYEERGIGPDQVAALTEPLLEVDPEAETARKAAVAANMAPVSPGLAADTDEVLFADLWRRPDLAPRDRSLVTVCALIAMGQSEQMGFHLKRAMDNGLTADQLGHVISHLAYYVGWPRAVSAATAARPVLDGRA